MPEDKISKLSDDLLVQILLLVSTKDAVATTVLSKRWRFIWTMMPRLEYKESNDDDKRKKIVWWFLDQSLQLHKAPVLDSLCIKLGPQCPVNVDVVKWVAKAVDRFVRKLKFKLLWSADPISLPKSLYTCETLVKLNLSHKLVRCSTINFSRLSELIICPDESDWLEPLILLLGNSPKLKKLLVDYGPTETPEDLPLSWNEPSSVPGCFSSHLEIFEWIVKYGGRVEEKEFVTYILANSRCFKRATISLRSAFNLEEKQKVIEELESIPRVSKSSQLLLK
ncbi:F-box domain [Arabidopsis suecica]|uniref:F-box domain n=1 Tax=Arabidopsis suecica TaxID=45249 RepID=A0A8T1XNI6_ARASU|nr:F-box domain [Arabidopsis suecica]